MSVVTGASLGRAQRRAAGFTYTEVLVATALIAILMLPAIDALHSGIQGSEIHAEEAGYQLSLVGKMEEVLAQPFGDLAQAADTAGGPTNLVGAYSDAAGSAGRRLVYLARYDGDDADADGDPFTGTDDGLLWVRVAIEGTPHGLESLTSQ
jgi:prepilin-type N-terminal cleavage/methylation domain-containing protein